MTTIITRLPLENFSILSLSLSLSLSLGFFPIYFEFHSYALHERQCVRCAASRIRMRVRQASSFARHLDYKLLSLPSGIWKRSAFPSFQRVSTSFPCFILALLLSCRAIDIYNFPQFTFIYRYFLFFFFIHVRQNILNISIVIINYILVFYIYISI